MSNIADRYAQIKMQIESLEAELKVIKQLVVATGMKEIKGDHFGLKIKYDAKRDSYPKENLLKFLTEEQLAACTKTTQYEVITYKAVLPAGGSNDRVAA